MMIIFTMLPLYSALGILAAYGALLVWYHPGPGF